MRILERRAGGVWAALFVGLVLLAASCAGGAFAGGAAGAAPPSLQIIHAGHVIAEPGRAPRAGVSIVIEGERIRSIQPGFVSADSLGGDASAAGARIVDLRDKWVLPGLIDTHVHLSSIDKPQLLTRSDAFLAVRAAANAQKALKAGFTTVRDLGSVGGVVNGVRDAVDAGFLDGPRIISAGPFLSKVGAHTDIASGFRPEIGVAFADRTMQCVGPVDCERQVRRILDRGADVVKLVADSVATADGPVDFSDAELEAIVRTARSRGAHVAVHAHTDAAISAALRAGARSVEHSTHASDRTVRLFKSQGGYLSPTLIALESVKALLPQLSPEVQAEIAPLTEDIGQVLRRAHGAGVKIVFGTDAGVFPHGQNADEFEAMMRYGGLSAEEALMAATTTAAQMLDMSDNIGALKPGAYADVIAVDENPLQSISTLKSVRFVMKGGQTIGTAP